MKKISLFGASLIVFNSFALILMTINLFLNLRDLFIVVLFLLIAFIIIPNIFYILWRELKIAP